MALDPAMIHKYLDAVPLIFTFEDTKNNSSFLLTLTTREAAAVADIVQPHIEVNCSDPRFLGWDASTLVENIEGSDWEAAFNAGQWGDVRPVII